MGQKGQPGPDERWTSFHGTWSANFQKDFTQEERPFWEQFVRSSRDYEALCMTMRHFVNRYINARDQDRIPSRPGLEEFKKYYFMLIADKKRQSPEATSCEFCHGYGKAYAVFNYSKGEGKIMLHRRYGVYAVEKPGAVCVSCCCGAGEAAEGRAAPESWKDGLFRTWDEARDYADKCGEEYELEGRLGDEATRARN